MASGSNSRGLILLLITSGFLITGLLFDYMPMVIDDHIKRNIELATNEEILSFWSKPPVNVISYYWLHEIANAEQFQSGTEKIRLRKVGPFQIISRIEKRIIELSPNKFRLTYNSTRMSRLNESFSADLLDMPLHLLNPIVAAIVEGTRVAGQEMDGQTKAVAYGSINKLFDRYNESLVHNVTARMALLGKLTPIIGKLKKIAQAFGTDANLPDISAEQGFGYAALTNNTWSGPFEIYTGYQETARSLGDLISYKGKRRLDYYEGKCNRMQVSAGELRPMPLEADKLLELFVPNFCRIIHLRPVNQVKLREGQAINYVISPEDFLSAQKNPDNRCFCTNSSRLDNHCSLDGVIDLAPCSFNAPILISLSNIELDPKITNTIADFDPEMFRGDLDEVMPANEKAQFVILKRIGVPIQVDFTATLMMKVIRDPDFKQTANLPEVSYIPLVTLRERVEIPPKLVQIIVNLESFISLTYHIKVVMYLTAIVLLCWLTGHYYCRTSSSSSSSQVEAGGNSNHRSGGGGGANGGQVASSQRRQSTVTNNSMGGLGGDFNSFGAASELVVNSALDSGKPVQESQSRRATIQQQSTSPPLLRTVEQRITQAAQTNDPTSGERANSADSSRSLPPSRHTSRFGSLDGATTNSSSTELEANSPPNERTAAKTNQVAQEPEASGRSSRSHVSMKPASVTRIFSRAGAELKSIGGVNSKVDDQANSMAGVNQSVAVLSPLTPEDQDDSDTNKALAQRQHQQQQHHRRRRGWFMNVYSRFVGMLNGIRTSIQDASQLDLSENDCQDKRLEMLAGKIDNWYSEPPATAIVAPQMVDQLEASSNNNNDDDEAAAKTSGRDDRGPALVGDEQLSASVSDVRDTPIASQAATAAVPFQQPMNDNLKTKRLVSSRGEALPTVCTEMNGDPEKKLTKSISSNAVETSAQTAGEQTVGRVDTQLNVGADLKSQGAPTSVVAAIETNASSSSTPVDVVGIESFQSELQRSTNEVGESTTELSTTPATKTATTTTTTTNTTMASRLQQDKTRMPMTTVHESQKHSMGKQDSGAFLGRQSSNATTVSNRSDTASLVGLTNGDFEVDSGGVGDEDDGAIEAAQRKQDETDKANTLKQIEAALEKVEPALGQEVSSIRSGNIDAVDSSGLNSDKTNDGLEVAASKQKQLQRVQLSGSPMVESIEKRKVQQREQEYEQEPNRARVKMINSSTSIDSVINSASFRDSGSASVSEAATASAAEEEDYNETVQTENEELSSSSSLDSRATQVAKTRAVARNAKLDDLPNQSGEHDDNDRQQLDESSHWVAELQPDQSDKWPASEARSNTTMTTASEKQSKIQFQSQVTKAATTTTNMGETIKTLASLGATNGQVDSFAAQASASVKGATKSDPRNEISKAESKYEPVVSSLSELNTSQLAESSASLASELSRKQNGHNQTLDGNKITNSLEDRRQQQRLQEANTGTAFYQLEQDQTGIANQLNGFVAAPGQPINVGSPSLGSRWSQANRTGLRPKNRTKSHAPILATRAIADSTAKWLSPAAPVPNGIGANNGHHRKSFADQRYKQHQHHNQQQQQQQQQAKVQKSASCRVNGPGNNISKEKMISHKRLVERSTIGSRFASNQVPVASQASAAHRQVLPAGA